MEISLESVYLTFDCSLHVYVYTVYILAVSSGESDTRCESMLERTRTEDREDTTLPRYHARDRT